MASSHATSRHGSVIVSRTIGLRIAIPVGGIAPSEPSLDTGMPTVGLPVFVRDHANDFLAVHLRA